jgi:hypothetical protein
VHARVVRSMLRPERSGAGWRHVLVWCGCRVGSVGGATRWLR